MADKTASRSSGSILFQILILALIVVLLLAILVPKSQWEKHALKEEICRQRMENINFASHFFHSKTDGYSNSIEELRAFADEESLNVYRPGFKFDRLTRAETGIDSFIIEYFDPYQLFNHYEDSIRFEYPAGKDSVILSIMPKPEFSFLPTTQYTFAANTPINCQVEDRGDQGVFLLIGTQGRLRGSYVDEELLREPILVKASDYIYGYPKKDMNICPSTKTEYKLWVDVKLALQAEMDGVLEAEPVDTSLADSDLLSSIVMFRWLKESDALAKAALSQEQAFEQVEDSLIQVRNEAFLDSIAADLIESGKEDLAEAIYDTTLQNYPEIAGEDADYWEKVLESSYAFMNNLKEDIEFQNLRDNIVNERKDKLAAENLQNRIDRVKSENSVVISESGIVNTYADSIDYYSDPVRIKNRLFKPHLDSVTVSYLQRDNIKSLLERIRYTENYRVGKIDSVGLTIKCPIEGEFVTKEKNLLESIFVVEGEENHGSIDKGDLSWSEKR